MTLALPTHDRPAAATASRAPLPDDRPYRVLDDRPYQVLLALRRGLTFEQAASELPSRDPKRPNLSPKTAGALAVAGARTLLAAVLRDRVPAGLPPELWPPERVRQEIRAEARGDRAWRRRQAILRRWLREPPEP